ISFVAVQHALNYMTHVRDVNTFFVRCTKHSFEIFWAWRGCPSCVLAVRLRPWRARKNAGRRARRWEAVRGCGFSDA
ncbi:MAG: hypothetical protein KDE64_06625, partial [Rhodocyclaceae bacterium]|nr:hypothetical protein [Rhodocyclaceae bacterium]